MIFVLLAALLFQVRDTVARPAPVGAAILGGTATTSTAGGRLPLRRAIVTISGTGINGVRQVVTDDTGKFIIEGLSPGRFTLVVEKPGYLTTHYGSKRPGRPPGAPIALIEGQRWLDLAIDVPRGGVIDGTVRDENGAPIASAQVTAQQIAFVAGERRLLSAGGSGPNFSVTDDRGHYRLFGLPPGDYAVRASGGAMRVPVLNDAEFKSVERQLQTGRSERPPATTPVMVRDFSYFPSSPTSVSAETVTLAVGEERAGVDIVNTPVPTYTIDFDAIGPAGRPMLSASIGMAIVTTRSTYTSPGGVLVDAAGKGRVTGLAPARYLFFGGGRESEDGPFCWVNAEVDVNGSNAAAMLRCLPGSSVKGSLRPPAGGALPAINSGARVQLNPAPVIPGTMRGTPTARVNADGSFEFSNVPPGRYRIELGGVSGWNPASATYQNVDTLDEPLDVPQGIDVDGLAVTITDRQTEISGLVSDRAGRPTPEFSVVVFSADRGLWSSPRRNSGVTRIGTDGRYRISALPAGSYLLAIVNDIDATQATDPMFLEQLMTGAVSIRLTDGQKVVQDLKIGG